MWLLGVLLVLGNCAPAAAASEASGGGGAIAYDELLGRPASGALDWRKWILMPGFALEQEQAIGFYSDGQLTRADAFPLAGSALLKILRPRDRAWGATDLINLVSEAARVVLTRFPSSERLQIGDVANRMGGSLGQHASHQNGLDADLVYFRENRIEQDPDRNEGFEEKFVTENGRLSPNLDLDRNWSFLSELVSTGQVGRIFVDVAIKKGMCQLAQGRLGAEEVLRRLRPWPLHDDHMHLRIKCPKSSPRCVEQDEPPLGSGCQELVNL